MHCNGGAHTAAHAAEPPLLPHEALSNQLTALLFEGPEAAAAAATAAGGAPLLTASKALAVQSLIAAASRADPSVQACATRLEQQCRDALVKQDAHYLDQLHQQAVRRAQLGPQCAITCGNAETWLHALRSQPGIHAATSCSEQARQASKQMAEALAQLARAKQQQQQQAQQQQQQQQQQAAAPSASAPATAGTWGAANRAPPTSAPPAGSSRWASIAPTPAPAAPPPSSTSLLPSKRPHSSAASDAPPAGTASGGVRGPGSAQGPAAGDGQGEGEGGAAPSGAAGGFQTARQHYHKELLRQGKAPPPALSGQGGGASSQGVGGGRAGYGGLQRKQLGGGGGRAGGNGFIPPYLQRAVDGMNGGGGGGGGAGGGGAPGGQQQQGGNGSGEGQWSERVLSLLAGPNGQVPPEIEKLDPKIVEQVCHEILDQSGTVQWEDVAGLDVAKKLLQEVIVWPMTNPQLFTGARAPPKGLLLFGPPGTGKTMIGKAVASNINATFFSISASSLTSKWIGEGEKMVRALFAVAACLQPSVIFIDEIDSILSARKSDGEHEASRRLKTEMLIQMEGCSTTGDRRVLLIGATNRPEELDEAARRRMPKQLYVPLPCDKARLQMVLRYLGPSGGVRAQLSETDLSKLVARTEGYSGSDMKNLIQEACQGPVRDAAKEHGSRIQHLSPDDLRPVMLRDFQAAARVQKASVTPAEVQRYLEYDQRHGAKYVEGDDGGGAGGQGAGAEEEEPW